MRIGDVARAAELVSALPATERARPEMRLVTGWLALGRGLHAEAVSALAGLEHELPLLEPEIQRFRAEAAAVVGPFDEAASYLERSPLVRDLTLAAWAKLRSGDQRRSKTLANQAVERAQKNRRASDETDARVARAEMAEQRRDVPLALADWRWLVRERPGDGRVRRALASIRGLGGKVELDDELTALGASATAQNIGETLERIDELGASPSAPRATIAMARATALYRARDYARAKAAYDAALPLAGAYGPEVDYQAAVSALRVGDDDDAIGRMTRIARGITPFAERAADRLAELYMRVGRYAEAADAYRRRMSRFGPGKGTDDARYGRALALLSSGAPAEARKLLTAVRQDLEKRSGSSRLELATLRELEAVAFDRAGEHEDALALFRSLVRDEPLTFPALVARARLERLGETPPTWAAPSSDGYAPLSVSLPPAVALLVSLGLDAVAEERLADVEQQTASDYPGRESEALCAMYAELACGRRRHVVGSRAVPLAQLMRTPSPADRWAWSCVYPQPYADLVAAEQARHRLPTGLLHAVMRQESGFRTSIVSSAGAIGLMQLMPNTAARAAGELGLAPDTIDLERPVANVKLGAHYLAKLLGNFRGNATLAVAGYNAGPHAVLQWSRGGSERDVDLWVARIPYDETRAYVARVLGNFARYQYLAGGPDAVSPLPLEVPSDGDIGPDAY